MAPSAGAEGPSSASFKIRADTTNNGVAAMSSTSYRLSSSLGDTVGNVPLTSASYKLSSALYGGAKSAVLPGAPTALTATPGNAQVTLSFTAPTNTGGHPVTAYNASCSASGQTTRTGSATASPVTVTGLVNGVAYSCVVTATTAIGVSQPSAAVNVTPVNPGIPGFSISATSLLFGSVAVGDTSVAQTLTITNPGTAALTVAAPVITGAFAVGSNTCTSVAPAGTCSLAVTFTPTVAGAATGLLTISANDAGSPHAVMLSGTGVATPPAGTFAYVANTNSGSVTVINTNTLAAVGSIAIGGVPWGIAVNPAGTRAYVARYDVTGSVVVINTASNLPVATITTGSGTRYVAVSPDGTRVYASNFDANTVSVIDAASNTVVATVTVGNRPSGIAVSPTGSFAYVTNENSNDFSVIDTTTNTVIATTSVGGTGVGEQPHAVAFHPTAPKAYVMNTATNNFSIINTTTHGRAANRSIGDNTNAVVFNAAGTRAYIAALGTVVIDNATNNPLGTINGGAGPRGIAITPDGARVFVTNRFDGTVSAIDAATQSVIGTIPVGSFPEGIAIAAPAPAPTPILQSVVSRKVHGSAGPFDVNIDFTIPIGGLVNTEPRAIGSGFTLVFTFDRPITALGAVTSTDSAGNAVGNASAVFSGNTVTVTLTGVPNNRRATVSLTGLNGNGVASASLGFILGDVGHKRSVSSSDISAVKARRNAAAGSTNFRADPNASGTIDAADVTMVKAKAGLKLP